MRTAVVWHLSVITGEKTDTEKAKNERGSEPFGILLTITVQ
jgi:hypothetical protein